jgi:hypothetical protein
MSNFTPWVRGHVVVMPDIDFSKEEKSPFGPASKPENVEVLEAFYKNVSDDYEDLYVEYAELLEVEDGDSYHYQKLNDVFSNIQLLGKKLVGTRYIISYVRETDKIIDKMMED